MTFIPSSAAFAAAATIALLFAAAASAQSSRTFVSGVGTDSGACDRTAPCQTFAFAIGQTAPGGEIDCLDPGDFGPMTITQSVTIDCTSASGNGTVSAPPVSDVIIINGVATQVQLIGLDINGLDTSIVGVLVNSSANVSIQNCVIQGFRPTGAGGVGVQVVGLNASAYIQNTVIRNNDVGVFVGAGGGGPASVELDHVFLDNNSNTAPGFGSGGLFVANGSSAIIANSTMTSNAPAISNGGTAFSYGNNMIRGAISGNPLTTTARQ